MPGDLNEKVEIPVWFLKLGAYLCAGIGALVISWATWLTINVMDYRLDREKLAEMSMEIKRIDSCTTNMLRSIDSIVARMKWEQEKTTQTKIP